MTEETRPESWEAWMDNPLQTDQPQGAEHHEVPLYVTQTRESSGRWADFLAPRADRDEVTRIQAYRLQDDPTDTMRVWRREVRWVLEEVPGDGLGQTPPGQIMARNIENTNRLLAVEENQQPVE